MPRPGLSYESRAAAAALDREIEASLRRQFSVPGPFLKPGEGFVPTATSSGGTGAGFGGWSWNLRLNLPSGSPLRKAAGLLLAASLWGGTGLVIYSSYGTSRGPVRSVGAASQPKIDPASPVGRLAQEQWSQQFRSRRSAQSDQQPDQAQLWQTLVLALEARGIPVDRLGIHQEEDGVQLLSVSELISGDRELLMVSASFDGNVETAVLEQALGQTSAMGVAASGVDEALTRPAPVGSLPGLYRGEYAGGFVYSVSRSEPRLPAAFFAITEMQFVQEISRAQFERRPVLLSPELVTPAP